ncbi:MAG: transcriptional repressor [Clostridiales bacterium]|nr:transcriptional repressor [Clostridiales bacterium]
MKNYSKQREEIEQAVFRHSNHPTAEDIYLSVKACDSSASISTVYRNLQGMEQQGVVRRLHMPSGSDRYDTNCAPHQHFYCTLCGKITDLELPADLRQYEQLLVKRLGASLSYVGITLEGVCRECLEKEKEKET